MAQALSSAQQSLQRAGQEPGEQDESSEAAMGREPGSGSKPGQGNGQLSAGGPARSSDSAQNGRSRARGSGRGGPGIGYGGNIEDQQPLPGAKRDLLVKGNVDPRGKKLTRSYKDTPDPVKDRAAYYEVVPDKVRAAEASLNREEIPAGYKRQVRDYFEAIRQP
jgi:hypothetical protein